MPKQPYRQRTAGGLLLALGLCFFFYQPASAQETITLTGCLSTHSGKFYLEPLESSTAYELRGNTSALEPFVNKEISVQGQKTKSSRSHPTFRVVNSKVVFDTPDPALSKSFRHLSHWRIAKIPAYGFEFTHLKTKSHRKTNEDIRIPESLEPYFSTSKGAEDAGRADPNVVAIAGFDMPASAYPNTNFMGGSFTALVNPEIKKRSTCNQFSSGEPPAFYTFGGTRYASVSSSGAAMGTGSSEYYFHTFQNGFCYELAFQFFTHTTGNGPNPWCTYASVDEHNFFDMIKPIMDRISFFRPTPKKSKQAH